MINSVEFTRNLQGLSPLALADANREPPSGHQAALQLLTGLLAMVFPVVMYGWSWTIKKAEWQRIEAFKPWCWRRPLRVPWTARRSNQSILKEISPEYSLEGLMLKVNLQ